VSKKSKRATKKVSRRYKALEAAAREIRKNSPIIRRKLRKAGVKPDPALVFSAAQYYEALKKLAKA
jgi:hypothetical protein